MRDELIIRDSQMKVLAAGMFERWLVEHVTRCFPQDAAELGANLLASIRERLARAARYFSSEPDLAAFVDLTFLFGAAFDENPQLPWARQILTAASIDPSRRADALYEQAREYLLRQTGEEEQEEEASAGNA